MYILYIRMCIYTCIERDIERDRLPISCCLLPIVYCPFPIAYCLLPSAYHLSPIAYRRLPVAYCLLSCFDSLCRLDGSKPSFSDMLVGSDSFHRACQGQINYFSVSDNCLLPFDLSFGHASRANIRQSIGSI